MLLHCLVRQLTLLDKRFGCLRGLVRNHCYVWGLVLFGCLSQVASSFCSAKSVLFRYCSMFVRGTVRASCLISARFVRTVVRCYAFECNLFVRRTVCGCFVRALFGWVLVPCSNTDTHTAVLYASALAPSTPVSMFRSTVGFDRTVHGKLRPAFVCRQGLVC